MIAVLTAAVIVLAVVTAIVLVLLLAVVRRLREIEKTLSGGTAALPEPGTALGAFDAADLSGLRVERDDVATGTVLFVMPGCGPCSDLIESLSARPVATLAAFVAGDPADDAAQELARKLAPIAERVAIVADGGPVAAAFGGIDSFPTVLRTENGVIAAAGRSVDAVTPPLVAA